jgi:DNA mismatch repair ATPase MutS
LNLLAAEGKMVIASRIGYGLKGADHVLRDIIHQASSQSSKGMLGKLLNTDTIYLDNTNIAESAKEITDAGLIHIMRIINQFTENVLKFFDELRYESGFYTGCINLYNTISQIGIPVSFPLPEENDCKTLNFRGLYDLSMAIGENRQLIANDLNADGKSLIIITGANQGGKSTFLRSIGIAQILMQCGLFVPAAMYRANICDSIFTHFTKEEDADMKSGKLDEELSRMNNIINSITPASMLLMNESFAATTERDGSKIATDIITALYELDVKTLFVTHMFEFADHMYNSEPEKAIFLRAQRKANEYRTFKIYEGKPLCTSYGEDLYKSIIGFR